MKNIRYIEDETNYVFDVDGTLTESRQLIDLEFNDWFCTWCQDKKIFLVSGSDYEKTDEQLDVESIAPVASYNCSGNSIWVDGIEIYRNDWKLTEEQSQWLETQLYISGFHIRAGKHIEERPGMVNFSIVGRNASPEQRLEYRKWDIKTSERRKLARQFNYRYIDLDAQVGGETGIDIYPKGKDKAQIRQFLTGKIVFFGDAIFPGGNDWSLAGALHEADIWHKVNNYHETWDILKDNYVS